MKNITYDELVAQNRARQAAERSKARKAMMLRSSLYLAVTFMICIASYIGYSRLQERKIEIERKEAEKCKLLAEQYAREREERRKREEELKAKHEQERLERERRNEEERIAREKKREEERNRIEAERREREKRYEEERLARERQLEEERAARARKREEERLAREKRREEEYAERNRMQEIAENQETVGPKREYESANKRQVAKTQVRSKANDKNDMMRFFQLRSQMGGSVLEPLIEKCNRLNDTDISYGGRNVKSAIMKQLAGDIGPVSYRQTIRTKTITSYGSVGRFEGTTLWGTPIQGDVLDERISTRTKIGAYKATTPAGFRNAFDGLLSLARKKHARACAEAGACIFVEATKGQIGMDDRAALNFFKKAADYGDVDGMFMYAFCLYYGIGSPTNKPRQDKAYEELLNLQNVLDDSNQSSAIRKEGFSGWIGKRMSEARALAK